MNTQASLPNAQVISAVGNAPVIYKSSIVVRLSYVAVIIVGLYGSLKVALGVSRIDPDACHSLLMWYGIQEHGLAWVKDWIFTQDNWLFSLVPFHFLGFLAFGATPAVAIVCGWLIFVLGAFTSGVIAWQLNAQRAAYAIPVVLLFSGHYVYANGFATYSTSHNITNLFGLVAILALLLWIKSQRNAALVLLLFILTAGAISDPWMVASYCLPMALVGIILWFLPSLGVGVRRQDCVKLFLISAISIWAVKNQAWGVLDFLPNMHFELGNWNTIKNNSYYLVKNLGGMFNITPFQNPNHLVAAVFSLAVVAMLLAANIFKSIRSQLIAEKPIAVFSLFCFFSIGGITLAYIIGNIEANALSARFLLNVLYVMVIGLGVFMDRQWQMASRAGRIVSAIITVLFLTAGIASTAPSWVRPGFAIKDADTIAILNFLQQHNLSYGYGPYWGSHANAVSVVALAEKSNIRVRPAVFDRTTGALIGGIRAQSSKRWYRADDAPRGQKDFFVFVKSDGEECADINICLNGLKKQFGEPVKALKFGDAIILVWNHPLLGYRSV